MERGEDAGFLIHIYDVQDSSKTFCGIVVSNVEFREDVWLSSLEFYYWSRCGKTSRDTMCPGCEEKVIPIVMARKLRG